MVNRINRDITNCDKEVSCDQVFLSSVYLMVRFCDAEVNRFLSLLLIYLQWLLDLSGGLVVRGGLVRWVKDFLTDCPQRLCVKAVPSNEVVLNTGAPQGCVLSPLLFSVYTNKITLHNSNFKLFKYHQYGDGMALVGFFHENDDASKYLQVRTVV